MVVARPWIQNSGLVDVYSVSEDHALSEEDVKAFCRDQITHFKVPTHVRFVDDFPMTVTGKIQKFKMRDAMLEAG